MMQVPVRKHVAVDDVEDSSPQRRWKNLRRSSAWGSHPAVAVGPGHRFADANDDSMFTSGIIYWERELFKFRRKPVPFTELEEQKAREVAGEGFELIPPRAGLTVGACGAIREGLAGLLESFSLLIPFKQVRVFTDRGVLRVSAVTLACHPPLWVDRTGFGTTSGFIFANACSFSWNVHWQTVLLVITSGLTCFCIWPTKFHNLKMDFVPTKRRCGSPKRSKWYVFGV